MQEAKIETQELDRLIEKLTKSPQILSEAKRLAYEHAAPELKALLDREIGGSGRVRGWQEAMVGSKGGYAKVRPKPRTFAESRTTGRPTKYAVGYVTNAINKGHRFPTRKSFAGERGYYTAGAWVPGRQFYQPAQEQAESVATDAAEEIVAALLEHLGG